MTILVTGGDKPLGGWPVRCRDCGTSLTAEEQHYYEYRCEECEIEWYSRMEAWRAGGHDPELDEMYGAAVEGRPHELL